MGIRLRRREDSGHHNKGHGFVGLERRWIQLGGCGRQSEVALRKERARALPRGNQAALHSNPYTPALMALQRGKAVLG